MIEIANNAKEKSTDYEFQHVTDEDNNNTSNHQPSGTPVSIEVKSEAVTPFINIETILRKFYFFKTETIYQGQSKLPSQLSFDNTGRKDSTGSATIGRAVNPTIHSLLSPTMSKYSQRSDRLMQSPSLSHSIQVQNKIEDLHEYVKKIN